MQKIIPLDLRAFVIESQNSTKAATNRQGDIKM